MPLVSRPYHHTFIEGNGIAARESAVKRILQLPCEKPNILIRFSALS
jgi:hypothetical protein